MHVIREKINAIVNFTVIYSAFVVVVWDAVFWAKIVSA